MIESLGAQQPLPKPHEPSAELTAEKKAVIESAQKGRLEIISNSFTNIISKIDEHPKAKGLVLKGLDFTVVGTYTMGKKAWTGETSTGDKIPPVERVLYALSSALAIAAKGFIVYGLVDGGNDGAMMGGVTTAASFSMSGLANVAEIVRGVAGKYQDLVVLKTLAEKAIKIKSLFV